MTKQHDELAYVEADELRRIETDNDLIGSLYQVPDRWWGFAAVGRDEHPGVCVERIAGTEKVKLLKGTDPKSARYNHSQVLIEPDETNGLMKATSFSIRPYPFSARRVAQLHFDRLIGKLRDDQLRLMQTELVRIFGNPESSAT